MTKRHFSEGHQRELKRIFAELADFIHQHRIKQVIGSGPSAYPYAIALERAYRNRYGKPLHVVNLGTLGETLSRLGWISGKKEALQNAEALLHCFRPRIKKRHSLLLEELVVGGKFIGDLSYVLKKLGLRNKKATIVKISGAGAYAFMDYVGRNVGMRTSRHHSFAESVYFGRGKAFGGTSGGGPPVEVKRPQRNWPAFMRQIHRELREVADSVPKKETK